MNILNIFMYLMYFSWQQRTEGFESSKEKKKYVECSPKTFLLQDCLYSKINENVPSFRDLVTSSGVTKEQSNPRGKLSTGPTRRGSHWGGHRASEVEVGLGRVAEP